MADNNLPPIVIKRKKAGHHGHHGGAWKVAYADFVTAMMAFFLLMWLLNVTTEEQKSGIADYFAPSLPTAESSSGLGMMPGGATITVPGTMASDAAPVAISDPIPTQGINMTESEEDLEGAPSEDSSEFADQKKPEKPTDEQLDKALEEREKKMFDEVAKELQEAIEATPELADLKKALVIDQTPEGLRIQLVDQEGYSMFPRGSAVMEARARQLLGLVAKAVVNLPNQLSISGHTDSAPYVTPNGTYSNWELSSDRANAARRVLTQDNIPEARIRTVVGRADKEHFVKENPLDPRNRRLSIILLKQSLTGGAKASADSNTVPAD